MSFVPMLRSEPRALAFGLLHTFAATIGQTFVIALFLPGIKQSFGLSDAEVSLIFTGTTLASAILLWKVGAWLDRSDVVRYSLACGVFLALSCGVIAISRELAIFIAGMLCLRLAGNGLLTHVALTATARHFVSGRGQALSIVLLGSTFGEVGLVVPVVWLIAEIGWRWTLAAAGCLGLALVLAAAATVLNELAFRGAHAHAAESTPSRAHQRRAPSAAASRSYFRLTAPLFVAMPMTVTAGVFHQALIAEMIGVSLEWFAVAFVACAVARVVTSVLMGPVIDRVGSSGLFCAHLLPLAAGTIALITVEGRVVVPLYWVCVGVTSGLGIVLQTTVVAERVTLARLAAARSLLGAATIVASALGPTLYGLGLAAGAGMRTILWVSVAALLAATAAGVVALRADADAVTRASA
jgi:predicted MFS family arabinose efflux permease